MRQFEMLTLADYARLNEERHEILNAILTRNLTDFESYLREFPL